MKTVVFTYRDNDLYGTYVPALEKGLAERGVEVKTFVYPRDTDPANITNSVNASQIREMAEDRKNFLVYSDHTVRETLDINCQWNLESIFSAESILGNKTFAEIFCDVLDVTISQKPDVVHIITDCISDHLNEMSFSDKDAKFKEWEFLDKTTRGGRTNWMVVQDIKALLKKHCGSDVRVMEHSTFNDMVVSTSHYRGVDPYKEKEEGFDFKKIPISGTKPHELVIYDGHIIIPFLLWGHNRDSAWKTLGVEPFCFGGYMIRAPYEMGKLSPDPNVNALVEHIMKYAR